MHPLLLSYYFMLLWKEDAYELSKKRKLVASTTVDCWEHAYKRASKCFFAIASAQQLNQKVSEPRRNNVFGYIRSSLFGLQHYFIAVIIWTWGATEWALCKVCVRAVWSGLWVWWAATRLHQDMAYICTHSFDCRHQRHDNNSIFTLRIRCLHSLFVMLFTNSTKAISIHSQWACARVYRPAAKKKKWKKYQANDAGILCADASGK